MVRVWARWFGRLVVRFRQDRGLRVLTAAAMLIFVVVVYVVVVVGGGVVVGQSGGPGLWLSVVATAVVAIAFGPVRAVVQRGLARGLHRERMSPYQVLAHFPGTVTGAFPAAELPVRMARVLAEGTGASRAEVWLVVRGRLELVGWWPGGSTGSGGAGPGATVAAPRLGPDRPGAAAVVTVEGGRRSLAVREGGELLGALAVVVGEGQQLSPVEERLFAGLAAQSGLMFRVAGLRADLERELAAVQRRTEELRRARRDLVARQDAERQRVERNIHDGAQQEVIALLVNLRLVQTLLGRSADRATGLLAGLAAPVGATVDTLTALSHGLYPRLLTDAGPVTALAAAVASAPIPVELASSGLRRCPPEVEAAVYFSCLEAVQNACKHSAATCICVDIRGRFGGDGAGEIGLTVTDDGCGFDTTGPTGNGLSNIRDRIAGVRGAVAVTSTVGHGTTIRATIPVASDTPRAMPGTTRPADHQSPGAAVAVLPHDGG